jgi:queuine tRNA-ribosyltransferase
MLLTLHNLTYYQDLMAEVRAAIDAGTFDAYADSFMRRQGPAAETEAVHGNGGVG